VQDLQEETVSTVAAQSLRNGVDTARLFATLDAVKAQPEAARFRFSVDNRWISGTHNRNQISTFFGAGSDTQIKRTIYTHTPHHNQRDSFDGAGATQQTDGPLTIAADPPSVPVGGAAPPTTAELLLAALASCLTSGLGNIAAVRKINLESVESRVEGDIDLRGILGLSDEVRNSIDHFRLNVPVDHDAPPTLLPRIPQHAA